MDQQAAVLLCSLKSHQRTKQIQEFVAVLHVLELLPNDKLEGLPVRGKEHAGIAKRVIAMKGIIRKRKKSSGRQSSKITAHVLDPVSQPLATRHGDGKCDCRSRVDSRLALSSISDCFSSRGGSLQEKLRQWPAMK